MENTFNLVFNEIGQTFQLERSSEVLQTSTVLDTTVDYVTSSVIVLTDPMSPKSLAEQVVGVYGRALERLADR